MESQKLYSLQALRAAAAISVVAHHAYRATTKHADPSLNLPSVGEWAESLIEMLAIGVDVFFVLSGFLMIFISGPIVEKRKQQSTFSLKD